MAEVLCVYREVQVLKKAAAKAEKSKKPVAIVFTTRSWNPGHRHDGTGFAASARPPCELRAGS